MESPANFTNAEESSATGVAVQDGVCGADFRTGKITGYGYNRQNKQKQFFHKGCNNSANNLMSF